MIENKNLKNLFWYGVGFASTILIFVFGLYFYKFHAPLSNDADKWGVFGDFVGGTLNPLLSFFGFIALLYTVIIQRAALESNDKIQAKQQFESTFFALLNVQNQILKDSESNLSELGAVLFSKDEFLKMRDDEENNESCKESNFFKLCVAKQRMEERPHLWGQYFFVLYELLKFVAVNSPDSKIDTNSSAEELEKNEVGLNEKTYADIIRASIPNDVLYLLAIVCYCGHDANDIYRKYKLLIERYALFKHIELGLSKNKADLAILAEILNFYDKKAFGEVNLA
ncbi:MAG: putative phage abortive infection protein [Methylococcaceae bacterium]